MRTSGERLLPHGNVGLELLDISRGTRNLDECVRFSVLKCQQKIVNAVVIDTCVCMYWFWLEEEKGEDT